MGLLVLLFSGCSGGLPAVKGKVVYDDGTAVKGGTVTFNNKEKKVSAVGVIKDDGTFTLTFDGGRGAPAGNYSVVVVGKNDVYGAPPTVDPVFEDPLSTPLKQEIVAGANDVTITVKRPGARKTRP
ncbi:MAG: hypothetical protein U0736_11985 [Gemmataceae bacterium]